MWGKNVDDTNYHYFANTPDAKYLCGRHKQVKYCLTSQPSSNLCEKCVRQLEQKDKSVKPRDPNKSKRRELTEATISLLLRLENFMSGCWNDNIQNRGPGGWLESEGRGFNYPLKFLKADGKTVKFSKWEKKQLPNSGLAQEEFLSGYYKFGSNQLPVLDNLYRIILHIEGKTEFCYEPAEMSPEEVVQDTQRQQLVDNRWWYPSRDGMSKERKRLLIAMVYYMCHYYSGFALQNYKGNLSGRPMSTSKGSNGKWTVHPLRPSIYPVRFGANKIQVSDFTNLIEMQEDMLLSGCCYFGANELHVYSNLDVVLQYLELRYGLEF